jgi:hypothetical protein
MELPARIMILVWSIGVAIVDGLVLRRDQISLQRIRRLVLLAYRTSVNVLGYIS